jgi:sulfite exporter TauE/SafE
MMAEIKEGRSLGELFSDLVQETRTLVQQEVQLAKTEMSEKVSEVGQDVSYMVLGGAIAYAGLLAVIAAIIMGLSRVMPNWLAALIVGVVLAGVGLIVIQSSRSGLKKASIAPEKTTETLQEDKQWLKEQIK